MNLLEKMFSSLGGQPMLIKQSAMFSFLALCQNESLGEIKQVILPRKSKVSEENYHYDVFNDNKEYVLGNYRCVEPIRMLYYFPRDTVVPAPEKVPKRIIAGVTNCDLKALSLLDKALINDDFEDPAYSVWRKNTYIISSDCLSISSTCHCNLFDEKPYAEKGYDLNLSQVNNSYKISVGSEKGEELLGLIKENFTIDDSEIYDQQILDNRQKTVNDLKKQNAEFEKKWKIDDLRQADQEKWKIASEDCIGCGACTNSCPTCYCMILNDESTEKQFVKVRTQDSCQLHGYARVAGGDSPRPKMYSRFRNRYLCKLDYMKTNFQILGCVGCGRCINACVAGIDQREVITNINDQTDN